MAAVLAPQQSALVPQERRLRRKLLTGTELPGTPKFRREFKMVTGIKIEWRIASAGG